MADSPTPASLARELGVSGSAVRRWLRENHARTGTVWVLDPATVERLREHFAATAAVREARVVVCQVDGCDRAATGRGWCRMHYNRWYRTGTTDRGDGSAHQRSKTHCPAGHPYDEANTVVFASDGRRRCRACRKAKRRTV